MSPRSEAVGKPGCRRPVLPRSKVNNDFLAVPRFAPAVGTSPDFVQTCELGLECSREATCLLLRHRLGACRTQSKEGICTVASPFTVGQDMASGFGLAVPRFWLPLRRPEQGVQVSA